MTHWLTCMQIMGLEGKNYRYVGCNHAQTLCLD